MAVRRTVMKLADHGFHDVKPHLAKTWKKFNHVDGQITQHLSPFEQKIVAPMFKDAHTKLLKKLVRFAVEAGPAIGLGLSAYYWALWKEKDMAYHHRV